MSSDRSLGFSDLHTQMKITNRLLAAQLKGILKQHELIALLATTGATDKEIADVLDTTAGTVHVALHRQKKKKIAAQNR